jgi:uncharacterized membrane protein YbhN (UPF0104 family)
MSRLWRRALLGVALGVIVYAAAIVWFDAARLGDALRSYAWWTFAAAIGLSALNYALRFWKWELCLGWLRVRDDAPGLGLGRSALIYLAGLSMSVSPGKVGEVLRSVLLRASDDIPFARTAPIVVADRLTDLVALVLLSLVGTSLYPPALPIVGVTVALVLGAVVVLGSPRLLRPLLRALERLPAVGALAARAELLIDSCAALLRVRRLLLLSAISVVGWGLECGGYWLILRGFAGVEASLGLCTFLWAATTLIGALSFLPGGIGASEGSLAVLVVQLASGVTQPVAVASTLLVRGATLWFGELVGGLCLVLFLRDPRLRARAAALEAAAGSDAPAERPPAP